MRLFQSASDWFWNEDVWLPPGYSWDHFKNSQLTNNKTQELFKCLVTNHMKDKDVLEKVKELVTKYLNGYSDCGS